MEEKLESFKDLRIWQKGIEIVKECKQFLSIALGSAAELETQAIIANELSFINTDEVGIMTEHLDHPDKMITSLIQKMDCK